MEETIFEDTETKSWIIDNHGSKIFRQHPITGSYISFNVDYLPPEKYKWFCTVVGGQIREQIISEKRKTKNEIQHQLKELIGV